LLYINSKNYLDKPFIERRRKLEKSISLTGDVFKDTIILAPEVITKEEKKIDLIFDDAVTKGLGRNYCQEN